MYLVSYSGNWNDEINVDGFVMVSDHKKELISDLLTNYDETVYINTGGDDEIEYDNGSELLEEISFEKVLQMASEFLAETADITEVYRELQDQEISDWMQRIEEVVEETTFPVSLQEDVTDRMGTELELFTEVKPNDWLIYNAFNYQLNHNGELKAKQGKKDKVDQEVLAYLLKY